MAEQRQKDCLNTIRLLAALNVLFNHSHHLHLVGVPVLAERFIPFFAGIPTFFTLSGFLIWMSIGRSKSFGEYCRKRFWRIYPELWVAVIVEIAVLLILFEGRIEWLKFGIFVVGQGTIFPFWVPDFLRCYGCGTPNGALWTIFALVQFYILAFPAYHFLHGKGLKRWSASFLGLVVLSILLRFSMSYLPLNIGKVLAISAVPTFWMFMLGSLVSEYKEKLLPLILRFWYVPVVFRMLTLFVDCPELPTCNYGFFHTIIVFLVVLAIGYKFPVLNVKTDISYGIYVYHMTIINAMIAIGFVNVGVEGFVVAAIVTCIFAWLSKRVVGDYSQRMKTQIEVLRS